MSIKSSFIACSLLTLALASCSNQPKGWGVAGEVNGVGDYTLALEGFNNGHWYLVDSLHTKNGEFKYLSETPAAYPEIMRLGLEGKYIYFPVDSVDQVSIFADATEFNIKYRLDGTLQARTIKTLDSLINVSVAEKGVTPTLEDATLKHDLFLKAFDDPSVMPLYYLIYKSIGDAPLYDVTNPADLRMYGAVAQRFATEAPDDPRGKMLAAIFKNARASINPQVMQIEVPETSIIDIVRYDSKGNSHSLADMASKGDVVLLSFTAYGIESSPAYNVILNTLYEKYHSKGLQIYQVAFDGDETFWKENVSNLPWTAVWNSTTDSEMILASYNVGALPTTFIIDRSGSIAARVEDPTNLEKELQRFL